MKLVNLLITHLSLLISSSYAQSAPPVTSPSYEYVVVGSGAGGGTLACRLAIAGHRTLLIEAGNDQQGNVNISIPAYQAAVSNDEKLRWDIFVNHYQNQERAKRDPKFVHQVAPYQYHVGANPPTGAKPLGILYPRAATLGGCVTHNALVWITPHKSDWDYIASITGDSSWASSNMNKYLSKVYEYISPSPADPNVFLSDKKLTQHLAGGAGVSRVGSVLQLANLLRKDPNSRSNPNRDSTQGFFPIPLIKKDGARTAVRERIRDTVSKGYPLTVQTNTHVTKIKFDTTGPIPKAIGVDYLKGSYLYRASPLSGTQGVPGSAFASKEVIISGGAFNTPQILKLSGIGPRAELQQLGIPLIKHSPGVGTNLQDRYETNVNVKHPTDFTLFKGCSFDASTTNQCFQEWQSNKGPYTANGLGGSTLTRSPSADDTNIDLYIFGGPIDFTGYYPGWSNDALRDLQRLTWLTLKAHTRNRAGTVTLRTADPLDPPVINFNYFDTGTTTNGAHTKDLATLVYAVKKSREYLRRYYNYHLGGDSFVETVPGAHVQTDEQIGQYVMDTSWGHHASCSVPIGGDQDAGAVLDGRFRVRGVKGLRVVDASVFPKIPGVFIQSAVMMVGEKAADAILNG